MKSFSPARNDMWYPSGNYKSQAWYRNTFLVQRFSQIARVVSGSASPGWNNLSDSGCHFTCLAMIIGCDPAQLASAVSAIRPDYFRPDKTQTAARLNDGKLIPFVWDMNKPNITNRPVTVPQLWIARQGFVDVTMVLRDVFKVVQYSEVMETFASLRKRRLHIICGEETHSLLVSGGRKGSYVVWEPDSSILTCEETRVMIKSGIPFDRIWAGLKISPRNRFQILGYQVEHKPG